MSPLRKLNLYFGRSTVYRYVYTYTEFVLIWISFPFRLVVYVFLSGLLGLIQGAIEHTKSQFSNYTIDNFKKCLYNRIYKDKRK